MAGTTHDNHVEHPPEMEASHREGWRSKIFYIFVACMMMVVCSKGCSLLVDGFDDLRAAEGEPLRGTWSNGANTAMFVAPRQSEPIMLVIGDRGYRLDVKVRSDTVYEGRVFCASHQGDVGAFYLQLTSKNMLAVTLLPSGQSQIESLLFMTK